MEFMGDNLTSYAQELLKENLYMGLEFEEQEKLEIMLRQDVEVLSQNIEMQLGSGYKGLSLNYMMIQDLEYVRNWRGKMDIEVLLNARV